MCRNNYIKGETLPYFLIISLIICQIKIFILYNLNKYIQYKVFWRIFEEDCLHRYAVIALYHLNRTEKLPKIFAEASKNRAFYRRKRNL